MLLVTWFKKQEERKLDYTRSTYIPCPIKRVPCHSVSASHCHEKQGNKVFRILMWTWKSGFYINISNFQLLVTMWSINTHLQAMYYLKLPVNHFAFRSRRLFLLGGGKILQMRGTKWIKTVQWCFKYREQTYFIFLNGGIHWKELEVNLESCWWQEWRELC